MTTAARPALRSVPAQPTWMSDALTSMVRGIAGSFARRLPPSSTVHFDDLNSIGLVALVEAKGRYDASLGVDFGAFARRRVMGAMLDELRRHDTVSRKRRLAIRLGLENAEALPRPRLVALHDAESVETPHANPEETLSRRQSIVRLEEAKSRLPPRLRTVLELRMRDEWTLQEIADHLGLTQGRACQLVGEGVKRLREDMEEVAALAA